MAGAAPGSGPERFDALTLARKEGFKKMAQAPARTRPQVLDLRALRALGERERARDAASRRAWHANLGPLRTPQLAAVHEDLWDIVDSNQQDAGQAKGAVALDAFPGLGKTTAVTAFARDYHRREIEEGGEMTESGHERWPVCRVGLTGHTGMKDFNRSILEFYGHPARNGGTTAQLCIRALDCVLSCQTRILIIDELHFLSLRHASGVEISNHFKHIANEFPVTLVFVGVGLAGKGIFAESESYGDTALAQTGRRTTRLGMAPFEITTKAGRRDWRALLLGIEQRLVLADAFPGMLAQDLSDYLFARSTGHIGSLMTLVNRGCQRAIRTGVERLTEAVLEQVPIDAAATAARTATHNALTNRRLSGKTALGS